MKERALSALDERAVIEQARDEAARMAVSLQEA
jgi:hypothetical protein